MNQNLLQPKQQVRDLEASRWNDTFSVYSLKNCLNHKEYKNLNNRLVKEKEWLRRWALRLLERDSICKYPQRSRALAIRNIITPLEKGKDELHLKFSSKNQKNPNTELFCFQTALLAIHSCHLVKHQAISNIISHYSSIDGVVIFTICHTNVIGQKSHFLRAMLKWHWESDKQFLWQKSRKSKILL